MEMDIFIYTFTMPFLLCCCPERFQAISILVGNSPALVVFVTALPLCY